MLPPSRFHLLTVRLKHLLSSSRHPRHQGIIFHLLVRCHLLKHRIVLLRSGLRRLRPKVFHRFQLSARQRRSSQFLCRDCTFLFLCPELCGLILLRTNPFDRSLIQRHTTHVVQTSVPLDHAGRQFHCLTTHTQILTRERGLRPTERTCVWAGLTYRDTRLLGWGTGITGGNSSSLTIATIRVGVGHVVPEVFKC